MNNLEKTILFGGLAVIGAVATAKFMKNMVDRGYPEIAKLPVKALDEMTQHSKSPEYGKAAVSVMSKVMETEVDIYDKEKNWWRQ